MSYSQEALDIESRLTTGWTTTSIVFGNGPFIPTPGTAWIRCTILPGSASALSFGRDTDIEYDGIIDIGVFVPKDTGDMTILGYIDTLVTLFNMQKFGTVDCDEAVALNLGESDGWYHHSITIPYSRIE